MTIREIHQNQDDVQKLMAKMPKRVAQSFSDEQIQHLHRAIGTRGWKKHPVDVRTTLTIPFARSQWYVVLLMGRDKRELTRTEQQISTLTLAGIATLCLSASIMLGLLVIYLVKSALGINLSEETSLGIWDWFKGLF